MFSPLLPLALIVDPRCSALQAQDLAASLGIPLVKESPGYALVLRLTPERLELHKPDDPALPGSLWVNFAGPAARRRQSHPAGELLVRAVKVRRTESPLVIDATAGLGRDGFLLAAAGYRVRMFENNPIVAALLRDGLERASASLLTATIAERIQLIQGDALQFLPLLNEQPDVIYLDPMFPERSKSAKVKQDLQLLQLLDRKNESPEDLLLTALNVQPKKVVVKRPLKGPLLRELAPSYMLKGKSVRFDVYVGGRKEISTG